nr:MAG TPA: hypothetical protein [Caudoviricetes sp.]
MENCSSECSFRNSSTFSVFASSIFTLPSCTSIAREGSHPQGGTYLP